MRQQTRPFIVEIKPSRKVRADTQKPSIWGKLDLRPQQGLRPEAAPADEPAAIVDDDRP
jgi:hypothetical protein